MAVNTFGVTAEGVRAHHFPQFDAWSASSNPTSTIVGEMVDEEAAELAGALNLEAIDASAITDAASAAYLKCKRVLRLGVALRLTRTMTGLDPDLVKSWVREQREWYEALSEGGATFLGGGAVSTGTSDPDGPTTHLNTYGLTVDSADDMSESVPRLRRDDAL